MRPQRSMALAAALAVAGCGGNGEPAPAPNETGGPSLEPGQANLPPQVSDFPALASKDCVDVTQFYFEALGGREWGQAALVWDDPVIDGARLQALFGGYKQAQIEWAEPFVEGAAGSLYCTVSGKLTDAQDPAKPLLEGTVLLKRVNDVDGATADQRRWTIRSSTFIEPMERSGTGEGA